MRGLEKAKKHAAAHNLAPGQLTVAWLRHNAAVTCPIIGVSSARQLVASLKAFDVTLSDADWDYLGPGCPRLRVQPGFNICRIASSRSVLGLPPGVQVGASHPPSSCSFHA
jgi:hypothetical protein